MQHLLLHFSGREKNVCSSKRLKIGCKSSFLKSDIGYVYVVNLWFSGCELTDV